MPTLTLLPRDPCPICGCRLRGFSIGSYRINRRSIRSTTGSVISWLECPECGPSWSGRHPTGVRPACNEWRAAEWSQAVIDAHDTRKGWA